MEVIPCIAGAFTLGVWAHWRLTAHRALVEQRRTCDHVWGEPVPVIVGSLGLPPVGHKAVCERCGEQRDVNADGTPYVPEHERPKE